MTSDRWELYTPRYASIAALLDALDLFESTMQFTSHMDKETQTLAKAIELAKTTLKVYLYGLIHNPAGKKLSPKDVTKAFNDLTMAWEKACLTSRGDFIKAHNIRAYEESIKTLLENPAALVAARNEVYLSRAELAENTFK